MMIGFSLFLAAAIIIIALCLHFSLYNKRNISSNGISHLPRSAKHGEGYVIKLIVKPIKNDFISGAGLKKVAAIYSWRHGRDKFFHRIINEEVCYTVCHLFYPGTFTFARLEESCYSGCFFIFLAHEQLNPLKSYEIFLQEVKDVARRLHGIVLDEQDTLFNPMTEKFFKEELARWENQVELAQKEKIYVDVKK